MSVRTDGIHPPRWIGTEAAHLIDGVLKGAGSSWDSEIDGYQFPTAATSVLQRILGGLPDRRVIAWQRLRALLILHRAEFAI